MLVRHFLPFLLLCCSACSEAPAPVAPVVPQGRVEVTIAATRNDTRTALDHDGRTTRWSEGDRIAVWAEGNGTFAFAAQPFALYTYNGQHSSADFSATLTAPMPEGTYTYYAVYPEPAAANGTTVTYSLPAVQDGTYSGALDILVAAPVTGQALAANPHDDLALRFRHLCHAVRIEIPAGRNLLAEPVKRLEITFPAPVAGDLTFDAAADDPAPVLSNGSNILTLDFPGEGLTDAEGTYAWAFVAPGALDGQIIFRAYNARGYQAATVSTTVRKTLTPGHTTPFTLTIPAARPITYLAFKPEANYLGEPLTDIHLTASEGLFAAPFSAADTTQVSISQDGNGTFRAAVYADTHAAATLQNRQLTIGYESANALLTGHAVTLPQTIADNASTEVPMTVPYLFEEDFSGIRSFNEDDNHGSGSHASNPSAVQLDGYGLPGWTGARVGGSAGTAVRACCHYEGVGWAYGRYDGRIDSAPMSGLKPGKTVKVQVSYDYDGGTTQSGKDTAPAYAYGYTVQQGGLKGDSNIETQLASGIVLSKTNDYTRINQTNSYTIPDCTAQHRLSWKISNNRSGWTSYFGDYFLYLDNIRVQIIP